MLVALEIWNQAKNKNIPSFFSLVSQTILLVGQKVINFIIYAAFVVLALRNSQIVNEFLPAGPGGPCGPGSPGGPTLSHKAQASPLSPEKNHPNETNK